MFRDGEVLATEDEKEIGIVEHAKNRITVLPKDHIHFSDRPFLVPHRNLDRRHYLERIVRHCRKAEEEQ